MNRRSFLKSTLAIPFIGGALNPKIRRRFRHEGIKKLHEANYKHDPVVVPETENKQLPLLQTIRMKVTAYCPCSICCGKWADGVTASGHQIQLGDKLIAAPKRFRFWTLMYVPGYSGVSTKGCNYGEVARQLIYVKDRGGAIKGNHIDVFFPTHQEALNWGVKYLDVIVYDFHSLKMKGK